jgi:O-palmitoleoyl-L-serine hydrolase
LLAVLAVELYMKTNLRFCARVAIPYVALLGIGTMLAGCGGGGSLAVDPPVTTPTPTPAASCTTPSVTIAHTASAANAPQLVFLDKSKYPQALCNDGTPAAYVLRQGAGAAANRWIISLPGGGECYDQASCASRAANTPTLVSSAPYQANPSLASGLEGLLDPSPSNNPDFYDASVVEILYCSSDEWSGAKASPSAFSPEDPTTWNFQGHAIVNAVVADLKASHNLSAATEVMLIGQSAGGDGVFLNVNPVAKLVPLGARFVAFSDAGFGNAVDTFNPSGAPPNYTNTNSIPTEITQFSQALLLWNGSGDPVCSAATPSDPSSQVACYNSQSLLATNGTITLPMLVSISEKDTDQLGSNGISGTDIQSGNFTTPENGYITYFAANMRTNLNSTNGNVSLFSPDSFVHVEATDFDLFTKPVTFPSGTLTLQQALGSWYKAPCSVQRNIAN